jgi:hypothetical protein
MIAYFTKMYQAVPALMQLYNALGGTFVSARRSTLRAIAKSYPGTRSEMLRDWLGDYSRAKRSLMSASAIVTGSPYRKLLEPYPGRKYMVFHGTYTFFVPQDLDAVRHFDTLCIIGPRMEYIVRKSGLDINYTISGYLPFLEYPVRTEEHRKKLLNELGLDAEKKTVLYVPTGKPRGSWKEIATRLVMETPADYNLILRPHPSQSITPRPDDRWLLFRLKQMCKLRGRAVLDLTELKLSWLYSIADLVITDGTSPAEEALYYDAPLLFTGRGFTAPYVKSMMQAKGLDDDYIERLTSLYECGPSLHDNKIDLDHEIRSAIEAGDQYAHRRSEYFSWVFGNRNLTEQSQFIASIKSHDDQYSP